MGNCTISPGPAEASLRANRGHATEEFLLWTLAVLALAGSLFFLRLSSRALWGYEGRWAEITREMQLSGNYLWPTLNGIVYYDKPLLSYWLVAGASSVSGSLDEFAARLPSAAAGLLGVGLLLLLARRLYDSRTATISGLVLATSYSYVLYSRTASADMETVAGVLAALALFLYSEERPRWWSILAFWLAMALTSLAKGLQGFVLPLLTAGLYSISADGWRQSWDVLIRGKGPERLGSFAARRRWFFSWATLFAAIAGLAVYLLPFAASYSEMHSNVGIDKVFRENVLRFLEPFDHKEPFYFYFYRIFSLMAPWSAFLPAALVQAHQAPGTKADRFLLTYFWATFLFFNFSGSRRDYYLLPVLPAGSVLIARLFTAERRALTRPARLLMQIGYLLVALFVVAVGALALLPPGTRPGFLARFPALPAWGVFAAIWLAMLACVVYAVFRLEPERIVLSGAALSYLGLLFLFVFALPGAERYRGEKSFAEEVRARLKGDLSRVVFYRNGGPDLLFYLSAAAPIPSFSEAGDVARLLRDNPDRWIISRERDLPDLELPGSVVVREDTRRWDRPAPPGRATVLFRPDSALR